jgi:hypothetical protein
LDATDDDVVELSSSEDFLQMQTMLLEVTATTWLLSCEAATLSMMMSCLSRGALREFSRWSSCSSGHNSLVVGSIVSLVGGEQSLPYCGWL